MLSRWWLANPRNGYPVSASVRVESSDGVVIVSIDRPEVRNAVDRATADALHETFAAFEADSKASVAVLTGVGGTFCSGADLKRISAGDGNRFERDGAGPMGPTRMQLSKPVIAAVEGHAVAGGLELAVWCDLRVAATSSVFGVYCRRWGVPLIDGGNIRLPRLIGQGRALDMILTGRGVSGEEALAMGLVTKLVEPGTALAHAVELARRLTAFPQLCLRSDRNAVHRQWGLDMDDALLMETDLGLGVIRSGETQTGATMFSDGAGRHGSPA